MGKTCFVFGAGPCPALPCLPTKADRILAADGGYLHCRRFGLRPHLLLGDFDSLPTPPPPDLPRKAFPPEKDETDLRLALDAGLAEGCDCFHLLGAAGGRLDHTLANLQLLRYLARRGAVGYLYHETFVYTAIENGARTLSAQAGGLLSVFCLGEEALGVTISGAKYALHDGRLSPWHPLGVSNCFVGAPVSLRVRQGCLLVGWERSAQ